MCQSCSYDVLVAQARGAPSLSLPHEATPRLSQQGETDGSSTWEAGVYALIHAAGQLAADLQLGG